MSMATASHVAEFAPGRFDVDPNTGCWLWSGARSKNGYASVGLRGMIWNAHRLYYEVLVGSVPAGKQLDHLCRVRHCVNPAHLEPVTHAENGRRGGGAKINQEIADAIRAEPISAREAAARYGISPSTVWTIRAGKAWT